MKALTLCQICGRKITEVEKPEISDQDIREYEQTSKCEEHGGNEYLYDEDNVIIEQLTFVVKAVKKRE